MRDLKADLNCVTVPVGIIKIKELYAIAEHALNRAITAEAENAKLRKVVEDFYYPRQAIAELDKIVKKGGCRLKGYKAFKKDMTCRGFQFKEGQTYETDKAVICDSGFHFCENPLDTLNYYSLCESEFAEVEALGETQTHDSDSKVCTTKIKIGAKLGLSGFVKASVDFLLEKYKKEGGKNNRILAASGCYSQLAASGDCSQLVASGEYSQLAAAGHASQLAAAGHCSQLVASGDCSQLAAAGHASQLAAAGHCSKLEITGSNSVGAAIGINNIIKASLGCWITLAEYKWDGTYSIPICVKSAQVDGEIIKDNVWYKLVNGEFIECNLTEEGE
jgi:hypothetical protein